MRVCRFVMDMTGSFGHVEYPGFMPERTFESKRGAMSGLCGLAFFG